MPDILKLFDQKTVLDYINAREPEPLLGEQLFPARKVQGLEFDILKAGSRIPVVASVHAFDTEAEIGSREASKSAASLAFIKRKMQLKEKDLIALRNPRTSEEQRYLEELVYNDIDQVVDAVNARIEAMRMEVLANGTITVKENNLNIKVDYKVPTEHKIELTGDDLWTSNNSDPIQNLTDWAATLDTPPTRILTSTKVRNALLKHSAIADYFKTAGMLATVGNLNSLLEAFGLPTIAVYDRKYRKQNANGTYTKARYFDENKLVMMSDNLLGETIYGVTPEESRLLSSGANGMSVGNVYAIVYETNLDPVSTWTKAAATAMPSFPEADNVFQAKVV